MIKELNTIYNMDCLEGMKNLPDNSIDLILCDLPYNMTSISWDCLIPFDKLWEQYKRIIKPNGNIVLFSAGLFTLNLIQSNIKDFRYKLIWKKNVPTGMASAKYRPMKYYEEICVFGTSKGTYNPIMKERVGVGKACYNYDHYCGDNNHLDLGKQKRRYDPDWVQPSDVLEFNVVPNRNGKLHPTQKPTELLEYLIKTYSNEGDVVLDNCMGSGSTAIAAINTNRNYIGYELNEEYYYIINNRIQQRLNEQTI
jgi:site-specific DNA-methyltransferase (adenine-specific)